MSETTSRPPASTTGILCMWNGTEDDQPGYIDYLTGKSNVLDPIKVKIKVQNIRAMGSQPSLLKDGFQLHKHPSVLTADDLLAYKTDTGRKVIEEKYYTECEQIVRGLTGAKIVVPFAHRFREVNDDPSAVGTSNLAKSRNKKSSTVAVAHCDKDNITLSRHIREGFGEMFSALAQRHKRYAQINVWRPVERPACKWPLAIIDKSGVSDWNYDTHTAQVTAINDPRLSMRVKRAHDTVLKHHPAYKYYYASDISPDEVLVFSSGDSDPKMVAPHTAFWDDNTADDAPARRSIEVRMWVFFDETESEGGWLV